MLCPARPARPEQAVDQRKAAQIFHFFAGGGAGFFSEFRGVDSGSPLLDLR